MNPIVYHCASGQAFFTGVTLVLLAALLSLRESSLARRGMVLSLVIGVLAILVSSTPLPWRFYGVATLVTLFWLVTLFTNRWRKAAAEAMVGVWLLGLLLEVPYHLTPGVEPVSSRQLTVIGDSVTAGLGDSETETWPRILAREHEIAVQDLSHVGDTVVAARKRVAASQIDSQLVLLEIGGNDVLGSTTPAEFATSLDRLLTELASPGRQLVMLELPLPPFYHAFGRIQRRLAKKHDVKLVPKRVFLSILAGGDATLDSIHLSQAG
ncbi:GDSL-type esterase/lipase family protein [Gimesia sp.]|uniref:SGNH/GDSL hydrolase family protein n=1 Tax=Gimesia sp. TaxID=2024833 RepID=UPI000C40665F|nr:GDSL-type esterase/lipase family protein [Gimesia sp.]MAX38654.1 acyl-CoA thioesterase [Gimesia sp.]|tara:strand:+ start:2568 stop:3368 length:801 start_codon:yes stop_codon:yes gene_type:complete